MSYEINPLRLTETPTTLHFFPSSSSRGVFFGAAALGEFTLSGDFVLTAAVCERRPGFLWVFWSSETCFRPADAEKHHCYHVQVHHFTWCSHQPANSGANPPLVISVPWLSWANSSACCAPWPPAWGWGLSSVKTGGGPGGGGGGGGQGALGPAGESNKEGGAMGPWKRRSNVCQQHCLAGSSWGWKTAAYRCSNNSVQQGGVVHNRDLKAKTTVVWGGTSSRRWKGYLVYCNLLKIVSYVINIVSPLLFFIKWISIYVCRGQRSDHYPSVCWMTVLPYELTQTWPYRLNKQKCLSVFPLRCKNVDTGSLWNIPQRFNKKSRTCLECFRCIFKIFRRQVC